MDDVARPLTEFELEILNVYLTGLTISGRIATRLGLTGQEQDIARVTGSAPFLRAVWEAKQDMAAATLAYFRRNAMRAATNMVELMDCEDKRTRFQASKDVLDRAGTAPTQQIKLSTPAAYREAVKDLLDEPTTDPCPGSDQGPA